MNSNETQDERLIAHRLATLDDTAGDHLAAQNRFSRLQHLLIQAQQDPAAAGRLDAIANLVEDQFPGPSAGATDPTQALDEFIAELAQLRAACGYPSLRKLTAISQQVVVRFREDQPNLYPLSASTLSDHLGRRRKRPPTWDWVACFILACHHHSSLVGLSRTDNSDLSALLGWRDRYSAMQTSADARTPRPQDHSSLYY
ncbi:hypothetical protein [Spirillospora sp. CA-294931]|uniref:hypothetical protein n=1 Tax=Spirillospora sp. CA-294931 TaxID=3240042 RepID=UPI003D92847E